MQNFKKRKGVRRILHNAKWSRHVDPGSREALGYRVTRLKPFSSNLGQRRKPRHVFFFNIKPLMQKALFLHNAKSICACKTVYKLNYLWYIKQK